MLRLTLLLTLPFWPLAAADAAWNPATTWVFAVGVLQFDSRAYRTWPDDSRADVPMLDALRKRGVPESQIVFLKNTEAIKTNIEAQFYGMLSKTKPGDSLIFYYAGHGSRANQSSVHFVTYDTAARWYVADVVNAIESNFKGSHAILIPDCCFSGAITIEAAQRKSRVQYSVLASAHVNSLSSGHWTFTQRLTDLFSGSPLLDSNNDGALSFNEGAAQIEAEMAICERQITSNHFSTPQAGNLIVARTTGPRPPRAGEYCESREASHWGRARIIDSKDDQVCVAWAAWDRRVEKSGWLPASQVRPFEPQSLAPGTRVDISRNMNTYKLIGKGSVISSKLGLHLIRYEGHPESNDMWLRPDQFKVGN